jgi:hypothetical protein
MVVPEQLGKEIKAEMEHHTTVDIKHLVVAAEQALPVRMDTLIHHPDMPVQVAPERKHSTARITLVEAGVVA